MQIISWNVASARARTPLIEKLLSEKRPDILLLQEIKSTNETFPFQTFSKLGYHTYISGQKGFNGVAILSKKELTVLNTSLPSLQEEIPEARYIECKDETTHFISVYVPNGNPPEKDPFSTHRLEYKLKWMHALYEHLKHLQNEKVSFIIGGDFNVIEKETDVYNPEVYRDNALMVPPVLTAFKLIQSTGILNAIRLFNSNPHTYSFWDFQGGAWFKNLGMLLDHIFIPEQEKNIVIDSGILKEYRGFEKPSDHVPVYIKTTNNN